MSWRSTAAMLLLLTTPLMVPQAMAQKPPETHPASERRDIVSGWDRSTPPSDIELWAPRTVLGYEDQDTHGYGQLFLTCRSNTDTATGRCPVADTHDTGEGTGSLVPVRFTEQRSGMTVDLSISAELLRVDATQACSFDYWSKQPRTISSSAGPRCSFLSPVGTGAGMRLHSSELGKLVAGRWTATLALRLERPPAQGLAEYTFGFDFTITDYDAVSIYLPEFDDVTPHFGLNLRYDPITQSVAGRAVLDVCLYDGLGSQSQYLGITARDTGARPPGGSGYSVWHRDGGTEANQRLDYTVTLDHGGMPFRLRNGVEEQLHGIDTARLRLVMLPGMTLPVFCVPTPLTLETPRVPISSKRPGHYLGDLRLELRVPSILP